jgi:plastocyanin
MTRTRIAISIAAVAFAASAVSLAFLAQGAQAATTVNSGDLVRGTSFSAVYYVGADGFRYVFPNDKAYFTWYSNFNTVKTISDAELAKIQIGGNVTYKPGVRMVKINTDPKTYAIDENSTLRHVTSEAVAIALYGADWNKKIDDIADGFFSNYTIGEAIEDTGDYNVTTAMENASSINNDRNLVAPKVINIGTDGFSPLDVTISEGQVVKFINNTSAPHSVTADDFSWGSGTMNNGETFTKRFTEEGIYSFYDGYDSANSGAIYVE